MSLFIASYMKDLDGNVIDLRGMKLPTRTPVPARTGLSYEALDDATRRTYADILDGLEHRNLTFLVHAEDCQQARDALHAVQQEHPEFFWLGTRTATSRIGEGAVMMFFTPNMDMESIDEIQARIESAREDYSRRLFPGSSDYDKVRTAYEHIIKTCEYVTGAPHNQDIQSVLLLHESVCAGYAKTFQYLLQSVGVRCEYVPGKVRNDREFGEHAWNIVCVDGTWCGVDVTWGDPSYLPSDNGRKDINYDYLCLTTSEMIRTGHAADTPATYPQCVDTKWDWYRMHGAWLDEFSPQRVGNIALGAIKAGKRRASVKFGTEMAYRQCLHWVRRRMTTWLLSNARNPMLAYGMTYSYNDKLRTVHLIWH